MLNSIKQNIQNIKVSPSKFDNKKPQENVTNSKKYFIDESDSDNDECENSFEEILGEGDKNLVPKEAPNTMQLIDIELINLLRLCNHLKVKYKDSENYLDDIMLKSF